MRPLDTLPAYAGLQPDNASRRAFLKRAGLLNTFEHEPGFAYIHFTDAGRLEPYRGFPFHFCQGLRREKTQIMPQALAKTPLPDEAESKKRQPHDRHHYHQNIVQQIHDDIPLL